MEASSSTAEIKVMQDAVFAVDVADGEDQSQSEFINMESLRNTADLLQNSVTRWTMFRVPQSMHRVNPLAYTPLLVSIGPFHRHHFESFNHRNVNMVAMEGFKRVFMLRLLERTQHQDHTLQLFQRAVDEVIADVLDCYYTEIDISSKLLARIILVDACFLLEVILISNIGCRDFRLHNKYEQMLNSGLRRDLALLENQIPFFVLEKLFAILISDLSRPLPDVAILTEFAFNVFKSDFTHHDSLTVRAPDQTYKHLLDLIAKFARPSSSATPIQPVVERVYLQSLHWTWRLVPPCLRKSPFVTVRSRTRTNFPLSQVEHMRNAKKLKLAGVKFERAGASMMLELTFINGTFKIPPLVINECTESLLRNLMAYEHSSKDPNDPTDPREYFASYVFLMDRLIGSIEDLNILESSGIIINQMGGREDATKIFYNISKNFVLKNFYFGEICRSIEAYCDSRRHRYMIDLHRHYLNNPWTTLSVFAAAILLTLTAIQTYYSYLGSERHH